MRGPIHGRKFRVMLSVKQRPRSKRDEATVTVECSECVSNLNEREAVTVDCPCCLRCMQVALRRIVQWATARRALCKMDVFHSQDR